MESSSEQQKPKYWMTEHPTAAFNVSLGVCCVGGHWRPCWQLAVTQTTSKLLEPHDGYGCTSTLTWPQTVLCGLLIMAHTTRSLALQVCRVTRHGGNKVYLQHLLLHSPSTTISFILTAVSDDHIVMSTNDWFKTSSVDTVKICHQFVTNTMQRQVSHWIYNTNCIFL